MALDLRLGRISLPTIFDPVTEAVGDPLEDTAGGVAIASVRRSRQFTFDVPIYGPPSDANWLATGQRLRRQVRALMDNTPAKDYGVYLLFGPDPEQNGWLKIGTGILVYAEGGVTFANYKLTLEQAYRIASLRTHRPARRIERADRRLSTTPDDYLGLAYATDFANAYPGTPASVVPAFLPVNVSDVVVNRVGIVVPARAGRDGGVGMAVGQSDGFVASFEMPEASIGLNDVVVFDRRGNLGPFGTGGSYDTPTGPANQQAAYGWEEVYGQNHPLSSQTDVPVLDNGLCRVRYDASNLSGFRVDAWGGGWVEQGKVTFARRGAVAASLDTLVSAQVEEWTPERAVVLAVMRSSADPASRELVYVSLQRGWTGPRFEVYTNPRADGTPAGAEAHFTPAAVDLNASAVKIDTAGGTIVASAGGGALGLVGASSFMAENHLTMLRQGQSLSAVWAVAQAGAGGLFDTSALAYGGAARYRLRVYIDGVSYLSGHLGFTSQAAEQLAEAEAALNTRSTTATQVADAAASGGQAVNDTQTAATSRTTTATGLRAARYGAFARVRVTTAGDTGSFRFDTTTGAGTVVATTTSLTYVWVYLGEAPIAATTNTYGVIGWCSAGTGTTGVRVDRVELVKLEDRVDAAPAYDGARDHGAQELFDTRTVPTFVTR